MQYYQYSEILTLPTQFSQATFNVPMDEKFSFQYTIHYRSLWDWFEELLNDPTLAPHFVWDAQKLSKFDSNTEQFHRFIHEPWTADDFWTAQVR